MSSQTKQPGKTNTKKTNKKKKSVKQGLCFFSNMELNFMFVNILYCYIKDKNDSAEMERLLTVILFFKIIFSPSQIFDSAA